MTSKILSYALVGLVCMNACVTPKGLPKKKPTNFKLVFTNYQGFTGKSENYSLLYNAQIMGDKANEIKSVTLTEEQATDIYKILQENKFETIAMTQLQTADRGGYTLELVNTSIHITKSHSGSDYVTPKDLQRFLNCVKVVEKYLPKSDK